MNSQDHRSFVAILPTHQFVSEFGICLQGCGTVAEGVKRNLTSDLMTFQIKSRKSNMCSCFLETVSANPYRHIITLFLKGDAGSSSREELNYPEIVFPNPGIRGFLIDVCNPRR